MISHCLKEGSTLFTTCLVVVIAFVSLASGAQQSSPRTKAENEKTDNSETERDLARWRLLLDSLIDDAKGLSTPNRAYALLDIAET